MKYKIEFELPDNETVLKEIKTFPVKWTVWGYTGYCIAKPLPEPPKEPKKRIKDHVCNNDYCELE